MLSGVYLGWGKLCVDHHVIIFWTSLCVVKARNDRACEQDQGSGVLFGWLVLNLRCHSRFADFLGGNVIDLFQ